MTTAADCQDNLALREIQYANEVPLFTVSTAQTERTQEHQRNHNLLTEIFRIKVGINSISNFEFLISVTM